MIIIITILAIIAGFLAGMIIGILVTDKTIEEYQKMLDVSIKQTNKAIELCTTKKQPKG